MTPCLLHRTISCSRRPATLAAMSSGEPGTMNSSTPMPCGTATIVSGSHRMMRAFIASVERYASMWLR